MLTRYRVKENAKRSCHSLNAAQLRAFPLSKRAKRPTSAHSRTHRAAPGRAFSSLLADIKRVPVQKAGDQSAWRRARLDFPKKWGGFFRRGNDISKVVYYFSNYHTDNDNNSFSEFDSGFSAKHESKVQSTQLH